MEFAYNPVKPVKQAGNHPEMRRFLDICPQKFCYLTASVTMVNSMNELDKMINCLIVNKLCEKNNNLTYRRPSTKETEDLLLKVQTTFN